MDVDLTLSLGWRHQSVSRADEPWVHALLLAVGQLGFFAIVPE